MRYWLVLVAKFLACLGLLAAVWVPLVRHSPHAPPVPALAALIYAPWKLSWALTVGAFVVLVCGAMYACFLDQRYRCRVCCRKLRMPITSGSWSRALTDRPSVEYICPYGHGKLSVPEVQFSGFEASRWTVYDDIWQELFRETPVAGAR